jgi:hypothetical protein
MQKVKIGHVHVYCPMEAFDFRVSVNCEFPCESSSVPSCRSSGKKDEVSGGGVTMLFMGEDRGTDRDSWLDLQVKRLRSTNLIAG